MARGHVFQGEKASLSPCRPHRLLLVLPICFHPCHQSPMYPSIYPYAFTKFCLVYLCQQLVFEHRQHEATVAHLVHTPHNEKRTFDLPLLSLKGQRRGPERWSEVSLFFCAGYVYIEIYT